MERSVQLSDGTKMTQQQLYLKAIVLDSNNAWPYNTLGLILLAGEIVQLLIKFEIPQLSRSPFVALFTSFSLKKFKIVLFCRNQSVTFSGGLPFGQTIQKALQGFSINAKVGPV